MIIRGAETELLIVTIVVLLEMQGHQGQKAIAMSAGLTVAFLFLQRYIDISQREIGRLQ